MQLHEEDTKLFKVKFTDFSVWERVEIACQLHGILDFGVAPDSGGALEGYIRLGPSGPPRISSRQFFPWSLRNRLLRDGRMESLIHSFII